MDSGNVVLRVLGILVSVTLVFGVPVGIIIGGIKDGIKKRRAEYQMIPVELEYARAHGERMRCLDCPHCWKKLYRAFYTRPDLSFWYPYYCRKFKRQLPFTRADTAGRLRCQASTPEKAMREPPVNLGRWGFDPRQQKR